jgi:hypothetical protein
MSEKPLLYVLWITSLTGAPIDGANSMVSFELKPSE